jgi:hypothetical protein
MSTSNNNFDTSPETDAILTQLILQQRPSKRLAGAIAASNRVAQQCKDAILRSNPGISAQEVNLRFIELNYGPELAENVRNFLAGRR